MMPSRVHRRPRRRCTLCGKITWREMRLGTLCERCDCYIAWPKQRHRETGKTVVARPPSKHWEDVA